VKQLQTLAKPGEEFLRLQEPYSVILSFFYYTLGFQGSKSARNAPFKHLTRISARQYSYFFENA